MTTERTYISNLVQIMCLAVAVATGALATLATQFLGDLKRQTSDGEPRLFPVQLGKIAPGDQWIQDYDVFIAAAQTIRTPSHYVLMVVVPKSKVPTASLTAALDKRLRVNDGSYNFDLKGVAANRSDKPVLLDPRHLAERPGTPVVIILDFIDDSVAVHAGGSFVLQSRD